MSPLDVFAQTFSSFHLKMYIDYFWEKLTIESFIKIVVIYFFIVWISLIIWVYKDVINRTENIFLQVFSILLVTLFTPFWFFIYLLIRPAKSIFERFYEEVEDNLEILSHTIKNNIIDCPKCGASVNSSYNFCPHCNEEIQNDCTWCGRKVFFDWKLCPNCGKKHKKKKEHQ